jgi:hypothetical protein
LVGDRAYAGNPLDEELRDDGIEMIAPHHSNPPQVGPARSATTKTLHATLAGRGLFSAGNERPVRHLI